MNGMSPSTAIESPKTPGGISKSLLTPCRRVGLSRKWRKSGCSPFISPLSSQNPTPEITDRERLKRKRCDEDNHMKISSEAAKEQIVNIYGSSANTPTSCEDANKNNDITSTPCRNNKISRKKSTIFSLSAKNEHYNENNVVSEENLPHNKSSGVDELRTNEINLLDEDVNTKKCSDIKNNEQIVIKVGLDKQNPKESVSKLVRADSKSKKLSLKKTSSKSENNTETKDIKLKESLEKHKTKDISPNNLTKECIVVIQNKLFNDLNATTKDIEKVSYESDPEFDTPLSTLNKNSRENSIVKFFNNDEFSNIPVKKKKRNLSTIKRSINSDSQESPINSQGSQEDIYKSTITVKKTYEKVVKPHKAKSTGSITQKDIDDLKARIEIKKKLLLAKTMSIDTEELRGLIKKWQKGCQDALMELLNLMKMKLPERHNMEYAEILQSLKIPAELVGYDSENDCFITPDDTNVLLSAFKL